MSAHRVAVGLCIPQVWESGGPALKPSWEVKGDGGMGGRGPQVEGREAQVSLERSGCPGTETRAGEAGKLGRVRDGGPKKGGRGEPLRSALGARMSTPKGA